MVKTMALELAPLGITVNEVTPGHIETEGNPSSRPPESIPLQRRGHVRDVGHAVSFLASPAAAYITGSVIHVDGGYLTGLLLPKY
jgi:NAD(P)-dependent dehydrogenase (short-subunit alcohol dehydrogenase family)